jgi:ribonuclease HI
MIRVWCDGSVTGGAWGKKTGPKEPVRCWFGWIARAADDSIVKTMSGALGEIPDGSANISEYAAVRHALIWLKVNGWTDHAITVYSDSQLIINQLSGKWQTLEPRLMSLRDKTRETAKAFPKVHYQWIPREANKEADQLSKALQV